jgi:hypothetical protein
MKSKTRRLETVKNLLRNLKSDLHRAYQKAQNTSSGSHCGKLHPTDLCCFKKIDTNIIMAGPCLDL